METIIDVATEVAGAMKPWTCTNEDSACKPFWAVVAGRSTTIRSDVIVAIGTFRGDTDIDAYLSLCCGEDCYKATCRNSSLRQKFKSTHKFTLAILGRNWLKTLILRRQTSDILFATDDGLILASYFAESFKSFSISPTFA